MGPDGPKWGQEDFFLLIQTFPTFWAEQILILRIFIFLIFLGPTFLAWAPRGPTHFGPHVGPPTLGPSGGPSGGLVGPWALFTRFGTIALVSSFHTT